MTKNVQQLHDELIAAGVEFGSVFETGETLKVFDREGKEIQDAENVAAVCAAHIPEPEQESEFIEYKIPIKAPDFIVATPDVETDPAKAKVEAVKEARKGKGQNKSFGKILLNLVEYIDDLEKRIKILEK